MLTGQIKQFWLESGCVYGYRKIHLDLRDTGQQCGVNRVWRLMKRAGIKAQVGYRSPRHAKVKTVSWHLTDSSGSLIRMLPMNVG